MTPAFGLHVIWTPHLQIRGTMIGTVGASIAYVFVWLEAAGTEITRQHTDHIIVTHEDE